MNRLICTYNVNDLRYGRHTLPLMQAYADRMHADLRVLTKFKNSSFYNLPHWAKIEIVKDFAMQDRWHQLLLIDLDVLVLPHADDIFDLCGDRIGVVQDMGIPDTDAHYDDWCRRYFRIKPIPAKYFNVGVMVFPLPAARRMLNLIHNPFPLEWPPDNHFLNMILHGREPLCWLDQTWNWLAPQHTENLNDFQMIHFAGPQKELIPDVIARYNA